MDLGDSITENISPLFTYKCRVAPKEGQKGVGNVRRHEGPNLTKEIENGCLDIPERCLSSC